jgi:hypothetical protein
VLASKTNSGNNFRENFIADVLIAADFIEAPLFLDILLKVHFIKAR